MSEEKYRGDQIRVITLREAIRKRPGMYIGSTDLFGVINYLVAGFDLLLAHDPSYIALEEAEDGVILRSDAALGLKLDPEQRLIPFEVAGLRLDGPVLTMFSEVFELDVQHRGRRWQARFEQGIRKHFLELRATTDRSQLEFRFRPDRSIFSVASLSSANFQSYLSRISHLSPGIEFRWRRRDGSQARFLSSGMRDLFATASQPYQYLHEPIHIESSEKDFQLEVVLALHSWTENHIWSFVNQGRAAMGGTHETGLERAFERINKKIGRKEEIGFLAAMALIYPKVTYKGCIKAEVDNEELIEKVEQAVLAGFESWAEGNPAELEHLKNAEAFMFAGSW